MKEIDSITRRKFIGSSALAGAAASFPYAARGENLQSDTIRVAVVGMEVEEPEPSDKFWMPEGFGKRQKHPLQHQVGCRCRCLSRKVR